MDIKGLVCLKKRRLLPACERRSIMVIRVFVASMVVVLTALPASAQFDQILKGLGLGTKEAGLSDVKIASGLKEALKIGTENTVNLTGKMDGYFKNEAIKILMPEKLQTLEKGLRAVGLRSQRG